MSAIHFLFLVKILRSKVIYFKICNFELVFSERSQVFGRFTVVLFIAKVDDAVHVLGKVDNIPRHNAWNVVPFLFLVCKAIVNKTILYFLLFDLLEELVLFFPFVLHF